MDFRWKLVDRETGEEFELVATSYYRCSVGRDGTVRTCREGIGEERVEETHHISEDPALQSVFGEWVWDLTLDPRGE